ncbi:cytochrome P450 [Tumebacillus permanentifrigoris]|uniref:Cytochrome P450 n=1 Tax=Tumebacillus permanentifrigoris TaxID=378543 RepID=A0A316DFP4_9BACL|nr:cytochrome P450 [Tumebacillus permanentifrigoris]PWK16476.1 cytochrome P450 [Tumebacillus permanentifrigoris]
MVRLAQMPGSRLQNYLWFQRDPLGFITASRDSGDMVSLYNSKRRPTYIIHHPELIQQILVTKESSFVKGRSSAILQRTVGQGVLTSEGQSHERQKRTMMSAFTKPNLETYARDVAAYTHTMIDGWSSGQQLSIAHDMMLLTLRIICQTMLGVDLQAEAEKIGRSVEQCIQYSADRIYSPVPIPLGLPTRMNRTFKVSRAVLDRFAQQMKGNRAPLLSPLLANACPDEEMRDQILTILIAGHETTANLLGWVFYLVARHPEVGAKLTQEVTEVVGEEELTYEHVAKLPYAQAVIQETLRLYPPAWAILRENIEPVELSGHQVDGHGTYIISPYALHRNPEVFPAPEEFQPERFFRREQEWPRFSYLPFGAGSRACIGSQYAMMEATLILASIWRRGALRLADESFTAVPEPSISLRIKGGLEMIWHT